MESALKSLRILVPLVLLADAGLIWQGASLSFVLLFSLLFLVLGIWIGTPEPAQVAELESELQRTRTDLQEKSRALSQERQELGTLMTAINEGILAVNREGAPLFFNARFALLFLEKNLASPGRLGEMFRDPRLLEAYQSVLADGREQQVELPLFIKGDLVAHYFAVSLAPLRRAADGPVYGAIGVFHDVTELKRAEKIRIDFVANVSHELRTPLTAIKGYTDVLKQDVAENRLNADDAGKYLEIIGRNSDRLMLLISDLLEISSLESREPGQAIQKSHVDTRELTERALAQVRARHGARGHQVEITVGADHPDADAPRVEQVLVNLLENAFKYVPEGGRIRVSWEISGKAAGGRVVLLKVSDNGPGISPEHLPRLFERFYRVDAGRARDAGGTGLGLAIVKHIVQQHGGTVSVASEAGKADQS